MNNNNDSNNEILFYKVIHNKYLFNLIMNQIESTEWIQYTNYRQINSNSRIKFKNIKSLEWMIKNNQYELLKCKLENENDIEITEYSLRSLVSSVENIEHFTSIVVQLIKYQYIKPKDFNNILIKYCLNTNFNYLKVLLNEPISMVIDETMFEYILQNGYKSNQLEYIFSKLQLQQNISTIIKTACSISNKENSNEIIKLIIDNPIFSPYNTKEYFKSLVIQDPLLYYPTYLSTFNEPLNELSMSDMEIMEIVILYTKSEFSVNGLQWIINNKLQDEFNMYTFDGYKKYSLKSKESNEIIKFINLYTSSISTPLLYCEYLDTKIKNYIIKSTSELQYQICIGSICSENTRFENTFPSSFNSILNHLKFEYYSRPFAIYGKRIKIKDKQTIDWLNENAQVEIVSNIFKNLNTNMFNVKFLFKFATLELVDYAITNLPTNFKNVLESDNHFKQRIYEYTYIKSIVKCNIQDILSIDTIKFDSPFGIRHDTFELEILPKIQCLSNENKITLSNYLISSGFIHFTNYSFFKGYNKLLEILDLSNADIQFTSCDRFNEYSSLILFQAIKSFSIKLIKFIMDGQFNPFKINPEYLRENINFLWNHIYTTDDTSFFERCAAFNSDNYYASHNQISKTPLNSSIPDILSTIELLVNEFTNHYGYGSSNSSGSINKNECNFQSFTLILNHLYQKLIQSKNVTVKQISIAYEMFIEKAPSINIQHNIYHICYYLSARSPLLIKYVMERPFILDAIKYKECYYNETEINESEYDIGKYLDPTIFTYNYILNSEFNEILSNLIQHLSILPSTIDQQILDPNYLIKSFESDLQYFIDIKRFDIFLNHLNQIIPLVCKDSSYPLITHIKYPFVGGESEEEKTVFCLTINGSESKKVFNILNKYL